MGNIWRRSTVAAVVVALVLTGCSSGSQAAVSPRAPAVVVPAVQRIVAAPGSNWVRLENAKPGSGAWRIPSSAVAGDLQLAGYADQASVTRGQPVRLYVTATAPTFSVRAFRLGWYGGDQARLVWTSAQLPGHRQPAARLAAGRMVSTQWSPSVTVATAGWPEGTYLLLLTDTNGKKKYVPLTVRSTMLAGRLVLVNAVTTYQAYNAWGGYSLYHGPGGGFATRAAKVTFDRPYDENGARVLTSYEQGVIAAAERLGLPLAYLAGTDLDADTYRLSTARGVVSLGHDEYWTAGMRATVTRARDAGTNLAFLGANSVYWRVRLEPGRLGVNRVLVGYKSAATDPVKGGTTTVKWRSPPSPRPESSLVGMLYECFPAQGALVVHDPSLFLLAGTDARVGSRYAGVVGTEIDRAYPMSGTPPNLHVVAHSPVRCGSSKHTYSDVTYYTARSGAGVFSVGTMLWSKALRGTEPRYGIDQRSVAFVRTVTSNLMTAMVAGPMGRTHPSSGNLAALHASASTGTGTGGPVGTQP